MKCNSVDVTVYSVYKECVKKTFSHALFKHSWHCICGGTSHIYFKQVMPQFLRKWYKILWIYRDINYVLISANTRTKSL